MSVCCLQMSVYLEACRVCALVFYWDEVASGHDNSVKLSSICPFVLSNNSIVITSWQLPLLRQVNTYITFRWCAYMYIFNTTYCIFCFADKVIFYQSRRVNQITNSFPTIFNWVKIRRWKWHYCVCLVKMRRLLRNLSHLGRGLPRILLWGATVRGPKVTFRRSRVTPLQNQKTQRISSTIFKSAQIHYKHFFIKRWIYDPLGEHGPVGLPPPGTASAFRLSWVTTWFWHVKMLTLMLQTGLARDRRDTQSCFPDVR